jgi:hypothetical protein
MVDYLAFLLYGLEKEGENLNRHWHKSKMNLRAPSPSAASVKG